jgi:predicted permease
MPATNNSAKPFSERLFAGLLRLLPGEFRERFSGEMETVFRDQRHDAQQQGRASQVRFWWETARGLVTTAAREHGEILSQDVDYACRMMRKDLSFTCVIVAVLALAIGAGTLAFSAADAILIQPLPFADGNRLVELKQLQPAVHVDNLPFSVQEIQNYRAENHTLDAVVEYHEMTFSLLGGREPERVDTAVVSANFFRVLGVSPLYGRNFLDEDDRPSAHPVLILSYQFWQRSFGGDPNVVGQTYSMNDKQHVVVGVLPPMPQFPEKVDVYMPTSACPFRSSQRLLTDRTARMMSVFATLKPGVSVEHAGADLRGIATRLRTSYPDAYPPAKGYDIAILPVHEQLARDIRPVLIALGAAAALLLLLACSNVAGLTLSRILGRSRELTVRAALGASRSRIVRSFVTEGILLAGLGGVAGLLLAFWSLDVVVRFAAKFTSLSSELRIGPPVIAFCFLISLACGFVIGLIPALGLHQTPLFTMQLGSAASPGRIKSRARGILVAAQLAFSVILLVGAGLTLRTLVHLEHMDAGFDSAGVVTARIYQLNSGSNTFFDALVERTRHLSGVESVALSSTFPLYFRGTQMDAPFEVREQTSAPKSNREPASIHIVTPDYFRTIGVPAVSGRGFTDNDSASAPTVVIVNQQLAQHYWPNQSPLGKQISFEPDRWVTVVGVVGNVKQEGLDKDPVDEVYGPFAQEPHAAMSLLVRSSRSATQLAPEISWIVHDLDRNAVITDVEPLLQVRENSLAPRRSTAIFLSLFALLALGITASGISGLMSLEVGDRKHEIGVRLALGATPHRVIRSMMGQALAIVVAGLGVGFAVAWLMSTSMSRLLYGVVPRDALTFAASSSLLVAVALTSSFVPLTRIAKLDPTVLLKLE